MTYKEIKKLIKKASTEQKIDGIFCYIASSDDDSTLCNFSEKIEKEITFNQLCKIEDDGLVTRDYDTLEVI